MRHIFVIDDTGSPGNFNETKFLKENRKTLVGVFIHSTIRETLEQIVKARVSSLNKQFGITELHLTDLVNGNKKWSHVDIEERLKIIMDLSKWFSYIKLPYIVQTANEKTFIENDISLKGKLANFDFSKGEDQSLFLLIARIKMFMDEQFPSEEVEIVMDEGRKKNNQIEKFKGLEGLISEGCIKYFSSKEFELLQIADFFAYSLNRTQMTLIKENKTLFDKKIYECVSKVLASQFGVGISITEGDLDSFTKVDYDNYQFEQRKLDGNLDSWRENQDKN